MVKRVCLVSGGSGGHLMPALALARGLRERGHVPLLVTEGRDVEREFLQRETGGVEELDLPLGRPRSLTLPVWLCRAVLQARAMLQQNRVDCVVSTGGRPSLPVGLAARSLDKPLFLLEQNAVTGRANRCLLPFARRMYLGLSAGGRKTRDRALLTGTPLRAELYHSDRAAARQALGLRADLPVVLVTGGSQGAMVLNTVVPAALLRLPRPVQVLHLSGLGRDGEVRRVYAAADNGTIAIVRAVAMDMDRMLGAADLVVCRGGGTTVAELMATGRPAIIVPYPHHRDRQQSRNAQVLADAGAALVIEESALEVGALAATLTGLLADRDRLAAMAAAAAGQRAADPTAAILDDMERSGGLQ